jgi:chromosome segregation ATPase
MTDLVERLRDRDAIVLSGLFYCGPVMREAATALEAKEKELDALRADFVKLSDMAKESERLRSGALEVAEQWQARAETAERELDVLSSSHRDLAKRLADMGRGRDEARAALKKAEGE